MGTLKYSATGNSAKTAQNLCRMVECTFNGGLLPQLQGTPQYRRQKICGEYIREANIQNKIRLDKCDVYTAKGCERGSKKRENQRGTREEVNPQTNN